MKMPGRKKAVLLISLLTIAGCSSMPPRNIGVTDGRLAECPDRPNCVSSQTPGTEHYIAPLEYDSEMSGAFISMVRVLETWPNTIMVKKSEDYIHVVFNSRIFKFKDDVQFFFPSNKGIIHIRSASRVGYSDLGVNRKRIEAIRSVFNAETGQ